MTHHTKASCAKPYSEPCERNQSSILGQLKVLIRPSDKQILEVGSGTGQHAVYFSQHLPQIVWHTSDMIEHHSGINMWIDEAQLMNLKPPVTYQVGTHEFPGPSVDVVFSANTLHIMAENLVEQLIVDLGTHLKTGAMVMFYGPFKYKGEFTSESNADFDVWLKEIDSVRGIRDFEWLDSLMKNKGFELKSDINMPANNQLLVFEKI